MIQYLCLSYSKIKILEAHVFDELGELEWIYLARNEIEEILHPIFAKNKKLEYVDLSVNKIQSLHPNIFDGLPRLQKVIFASNPTFSKDFNLSNMKIMNSHFSTTICRNMDRIGSKNWNW
jgi:Leucine-rich repeat (LRR) protein